MSGGRFDYKQFYIGDIAEKIRAIIEHLPEGEYSSETIREMKNGANTLEVAAIYAQRIDWLLSGDDGEDSFHSRLEDELSLDREE